MPTAEGREELLKMQLLSTVRDVNNFLRLPGFEPIRDRGEVSGRVIESAVALLNQHRIRHPFAFGMDQERITFLRRRCIAENGLGTFARARDAFGHELAHDRLQARIVKTFAKRVIEPDAEPPVNFVELLFRQTDHLAPDREVFGVALLQFHEFCPRGFECAGFVAGFRLVGLCTDRFVNPLHFRQRLAIQRGAIQQRPPSDQQHSELRAPIADVIVRDHSMPEQPQHARQ